MAEAQERHPRCSYKPGSNIQLVTPIRTQPGGWGDRLYVVLAEMRTATPGVEASAGIGWVQDTVTRKGLFVEHEGHSEQAVRDDIVASLQNLQRTRGVDFGEIQMKLIGRRCEDAPVCAIVIAAFEASGWKADAGDLS
jgi:arginine decarboxylase